MAEQLYWEDVEIGTEMIPLAKVATTQMLVRWAGASGDFNPLHYEDEFAVSQGVGSPIVHGQLKRAWLGQFLTNWIGKKGVVKRFSCQMRGMDYPRKMATQTTPKNGETWWCKGTVTKKYVQDEEHVVECDIWVENGKGEKTTPGNASIILPPKGA